MSIIADSEIHKKFRRQYKTHWIQKGVAKKDIDRALEVLSADTTEEYVSELAAEKEEMLARIARKKSALNINLSVPQTQWGTAVPDADTSFKPIAKVKTRSEASEAPVNPPSEMQTKESGSGKSRESSTQVKTFVKNRTFDIFGAMFCTEEASSSVPWTRLRMGCLKWDSIQDTVEAMQSNSSLTRDRSGTEKEV